MSRHVIIEGPDGSGKSRLIETLGLNRVHTLAFKPERDGDPFQFYSRRVLETESPTGFDRLFLSEMIYGPMLRAKSAVDEATAYALKAAFANVPIIVCLPPFQVTHNATRSRPWPEYQTDDFLIKAYAEFERFSQTDLVDFVYDWTRGTLMPSRKLPRQLRNLITRTHA
jgi:hypothetical protein